MNSNTMTLETHWKTLVEDPNNMDVLQTWIERHQKMVGDLKTRQALERVAKLSDSWLAKIWLTRYLLAEGKLEDSIHLYKEVLQLAPRKSVAVQEMTGHLGEAGYYEVSLDLLLPIYVPADHGPYAGFNLFNAAQDSRNWGAAQNVLDRMKVVDWESPLTEIVCIRQEKLDLLRQCAAPELN